MELPLWGALLDLVRAVCANAGARLSTAVVTATLGLVAAGFIVVAGFALAMPLIGLPLTALAFGFLFATLALAVHAWGRRISRRQADSVAASRSRAEADIVLVKAVARSARPLLPGAAFLAAYVLARRS